MTQPKRSLLERIDAGQPVVHGGGYLFEMERRGYLQAGAFVPEVVLEHPEVVQQLTTEFLRAGSDVALAFTYYGHREKLRLIGKEDLLEPLNREAIRIAKAAAQGTDALIAGNICNTNIYDPADDTTPAEVRAIFTEQVGWALDEGVDYIVGETFAYLGEAQIAREVCAEFGVPLVLTLAVHRGGMLRDEPDVAKACSVLREAGADIVGLNCHRGPATLLPLVEQITNVVKDGRVAAFPVAYRTTPDQPTFSSIVDEDFCCPHDLPNDRAFPTALDPFTCTRYEMGDFARKAVAAGALYVGGCCGTGPHHIRAMAEALGRQPEASRYSPDMSKHFALGNDPRLKQHNKDFTSDF